MKMDSFSFGRPSIWVPAKNEKVFKFNVDGYPYANTRALDWISRNFIQPSYAQGQLFNTLFTALESAGLFSFGSDGMGYLFAVPHHEQAAIINLLQNRFDGSLVNGQKITLSRGLAGDAAATYANLVGAPGQSGFGPTQNDLGLIWGFRTSLPIVASSLGSTDFGHGNMFARRGTSDKSIAVRVWQASTDTPFSNANGAEPAIVGVCREGATTIKDYRYGTGLLATRATASSAPSTEAIRAGMAQFGGFGLNELTFLLITRQYTLAQFNAVAAAFYNFLHDPLIGAM